MHHQFLTTVAIEIYDAAKVKGASTKGALLVLAQASISTKATEVLPIVQTGFGVK
jgi:hypothetical protein